MRYQEIKIIIKNALETEGLKPPLLVILGPTAVGKTEIAIQLAERLDGEIVSADSRLFYRGMDIGTAKPTSIERARVPHHLIDVTDPDQVWSLAIFQTAARQVISEVHKRGHLPLMVGGTGQYIHAVIDSWDIPAVKPNPQLRKVLEDWAREIGPDGLYTRLVSLDPNAAMKIDPRNLRRTVRALEVILCTGQLFSQQRKMGSALFTTLKIGLTRPRSELYIRIDSRIEAMFKAGLVNEVRKLLDMGYSLELPALSAIGYREVISYLKGNISLEEAIILIKRATRSYVRRQANWFKSGDQTIQWYDLTSQSISEIEFAIRNWLDYIDKYFQKS
jgi:tRNA dimethylallyltransferase